MEQNFKQIEVKVLRSSLEKKLFKLKECLDSYFYVKDLIEDNDVEHLKYLTNTGFYNLTGNIIPLFYQCFSWFWLNSKHSKRIKIKL